MKFWVVGWDPARRGYHALVLVDQDKNQLSSQRVKGVETALAKLHHFKALASSAGFDIHIAIEASSSDVIDLIKADFFNIYELNARKVNGYKTSCLGEDSKTDEIDAFACACYLLDNIKKLESYTPIPPLQKEALDIAAELDWVRNEKTIAWERFWDIIDRSCPEIKGLLNNCEVPWFLACFSSLLGKLKHTGYPGFVKFCRKHKARSKDEVLRPLHQQLKILEKRQDPQIIRTRAKAIEHYLQENQFWIGRAAKVLDRWQLSWLLLSVKGLGATTAIRLLAYLGLDWDKWTFKGTCKYSGLAPCLSSSGYPDEATLMKMPPHKRKHIKVRRIHRVMCNKRLKTALTLFTNFSMVHHDWAYTYYKKARDRGQGHYEALRNLAMKWLKILFAIMRDKSPYDAFQHEKVIANKADPLMRPSQISVY